MQRLTDRKMYCQGGNGQENKKRKKENGRENGRTHRQIKDKEAQTLGGHQQRNAWRGKQMEESKDRKTERQKHGQKTDRRKDRIRSADTQKGQLRQMYEQKNGQKYRV